MKTGARTIEQRNDLTHEIKRSLLQGCEGISEIARRHGVKYETAQAYVKRIEAEWAYLDPRPLEQIRQDLLRKAMEIHRSAHEDAAAAKAMLGEYGLAALMTRSTSLRLALDAQGRMAKLLGVDSEKRVVELDTDTLAKIRAERLGEAFAATLLSPMRQAYALGPADDDDAA